MRAWQSGGGCLTFKFELHPRYGRETVAPSFSCLTLTITQFPFHDLPYPTIVNKNVGMEVISQGQTTSIYY